jgi:hypothetical protein
MGELRQHLERRVVPLHVADLTTFPAVARGDHAVDVADEEADRLLTEHVEAGAERRWHDPRCLQVRQQDASSSRVDERR